MKKLFSISSQRNFGILTFMHYWSCENYDEFEVRLDAHCLWRWPCTCGIQAKMLWLEHEMALQAVCLDTVY